jgi:excisionase family DNA binding protein
MSERTSIPPGAQRILLPDVATVEDLAAMLRLSAPTVRRLFRAGEIPGCKVAGRWLVERQKFLHFLRREPWGARCAMCNHVLRGDVGGVLIDDRPVCTRCAARLDDLRGPGGEE